MCAALLSFRPVVHGHFLKAVDSEISPCVLITQIVLLVTDHTLQASQPILCGVLRCKVSGRVCCFKIVTMKRYILPVIARFRTQA